MLKGRKRGKFAHARRPLPFFLARPNSPSPSPSNAKPCHHATCTSPSTAPQDCIMIAATKYTFLLLPLQRAHTEGMTYLLQRIVENFIHRQPAIRRQCHPNFKSHSLSLLPINGLPMGPLGGLINLPSRTAACILLTRLGIQSPNFNSLLSALCLACWTRLCLSLISLRMVSSSWLYNQNRKTIHLNLPLTK